jgi:WD40 repeat protein
MNPRSKRFRIALSFPSERRKFVAKVADRLARETGKERILYDQWHEAEFARPRLATYLPRLYVEETELTAVFLSADYEQKEWCGLEWDAVIELIKQRQESAVMLLRFDETAIDGLLGTHGCVWIGSRSAEEIAELILKRLRLNSETSPELPMETAPTQGPVTPEPQVVGPVKLKRSPSTALPLEDDRKATEVARRHKRWRVATTIALVGVLAILLVWKLHFDRVDDHRNATKNGSEDNSLGERHAAKVSGSQSADEEVQPDKGLRSPAEELRNAHPSQIDPARDPVLFTLARAHNVHEKQFSMDEYFKLAATFTHDSKYLLSWGNDGELKLWDAKKGTVEKRLTTTELQIVSLRLAPDGNAVAAASTDGTARVWTLPDGTQNVVHRESEQQMTAIAFSPDGKKLAVGTNKGIVKVFDWKAKSQLAECIGHSGEISPSMLFSDDGNTLIASAADDSLRAWDAASGRKQASVLNWNKQGIWRMYLTADHNRIVAIAQDYHWYKVNKTTHLVDLSKEQVLSRINTYFVTDAQGFSDQNVLYTVGQEGFRAYDMSSLAKKSVDEKMCGTHFCFIPPANSRLVLGNSGREVNKGRISVYNVDGFAFDQIREEQEHTSAIVSLTASPDGAMLATGDASGTIKLWDVRVLSSPKMSENP